jgi:menaquinone-dependent protoporphyrinogen IX oxidase
MRLLIAYASKSGCAAQMSALLASNLQNHTVTLCDLSQQTPDPAEFDYVVLGGSIRFNRAHKALRAYLAKYADAITAKPHTVFLCCAFGDQVEHYYRVAFPREVLESAEQRVYFGGDLSLSRQRGFDKLVTRLLRNSIRDGEEDGLFLPSLLPEHVRLLAEILRKK